MKTPKLEIRRYGVETRVLYDSCTIGSIERRNGQLFVTTQEGYQGNQHNSELFTAKTAKDLIWQHSYFARS